MLDSHNDTRRHGAPLRPAHSHDLMLVVPAVSGFLPAVRAGMRRWLTEQQAWPGDIIDDIELATNEAVANVVDHAYVPDAAGPVSLHAWVSTHPRTRTRRVVVAVTDRGRWAAHQPEHPPRHTRGHGLTLMRGCMAEVHLQPSAAGTTVILISADITSAPISTSAGDVHAGELDGPVSIKNDYGETRVR